MGGEGQSPSIRRKEDTCLPRSPTEVTLTMTLRTVTPEIRVKQSNEGAVGLMWTELFCHPELQIGYTTGKPILGGRDGPK